MHPYRRRLPAPAASQREYRSRRDAAAFTALRPQVMPHITACLLVAKQRSRQRACRGAIEQAWSRFFPCGHRAENWLSARNHREVLQQPGPPHHLEAVQAVRQELPAIALYDLPDGTYSGQPRAPGRRENHAWSSRPSLNNSLQAQGIYSVTGVGSHVVISLGQREQCLRDAALRVFPCPVSVQAAWNPRALPWIAAPSPPG